MRQPVPLASMACLVAGGWFFSHRSHPAPSTAATPVYAYEYLEHVVMSHPRYSEYHHLELEYNAMVAQYQFEQWNYSQKAAAEGMFRTSSQPMPPVLPPSTRNYRPKSPSNR